MRRRCAWANGDAAMLRYHDEEWGVPVHDDRRLFELLILESAQAGLSWATILKKRETYRRAFDGFEPARVARFGARRIRQLLGDAGIVRNRAKIEAAVANARAVLAVQREQASFDVWLWRSVAGAPRQNTWASLRQVPAETDASRALSRDLKAHGQQRYRGDVRQEDRPVRPPREDVHRVGPASRRPAARPPRRSPGPRLVHRQRERHDRRARSEDR